MSGKLILVRHGESEWNTLGKWTGLTDVSLTEKGKEEAKKAAEPLKKITIDQGFCSVLARAKQTLEIILEEINRADLPVVYHAALNERDYGDYTARNKWEVKEEVGDEAFQAIRRGYDTPIPNGENLKQVCERVHPYYLKNILPLLVEGKSIVLSAHHNSLRALIKLLETISDEEAPSIEMKTGEVILYEVNKSGEVSSKKVIAENKDPGLQ
ncbi:2,3-bisphosphoglycerate-dependent phosphoglycerate mutase [Patescibacteria group bacterium]